MFITSSKNVASVQEQDEDSDKEDRSDNKEAPAAEVEEVLLIKYTCYEWVSQVMEPKLSDGEPSLFCCVVLFLSLLVQH
ncbi:hypothetical protein RIF29_26430 [Crotalaria pallida]|uniref:Uncharacterized protein n=1 Tax=Crotalaria pallida TaxID=3830 RepID=A0AAN9I4V4_CROPI